MRFEPNIIWDSSGAQSESEPSDKDPGVWLSRASGLGPVDHGPDLAQLSTGSNARPGESGPHQLQLATASFSLQRRDNRHVQWAAFGCETSASVRYVNGSDADCGCTSHSYPYFMSEHKSGYGQVRGIVFIFVINIRIYIGYHECLVQGNLKQ